MGEPNFESYFLTQVATPHNGYLEPALSTFATQKAGGIWRLTRLPKI